MESTGINRNQALPETVVGELRTAVADVRVDADALSEFGRDWSRLHRPRAAAVALPTSSDEVQALVRLANDRRLALVPSGGRTGMSGAALAPNGEIVVSLARMNRIVHFDPVDSSVVCQPGVITQTLQEFARQQGLFYPVDFGARGSSHIGGNIGTNAGGIKVIRYGLTRRWISGLKVVTGRGDLLNLNNGLVKNATGYDLRHLFIGSEGTLGIIVECTVKLTRQPREPRVLLLAVPDLPSIMGCFEAFQRRLELNAFECFSDRCLQQVVAAGLKEPFQQSSPQYVLLEFDLRSDNDLDTALEVFESCVNQGLVVDGVVAESETQVRDLWRLREDITESIAPRQPYKNDISVPVGKVAAFLQSIDELFGKEYPEFDVLCFGHVGDGNLHVNVLRPEAMDPAEFIEQCEHVNELLFATVQTFGGSVSAEHGVGITKKPYLSYTRSALEVDYMRQLKQVFDPNGIMNPGKIFD